MTEPIKQLVAIEIRVKTVVELPADWDKDMCAFWFNGSSHCITNELREMVLNEPPNTCSICADAEVLILDSAENQGIVERHLEKVLEREAERANPTTS